MHETSPVAFQFERLFNIPYVPRNASAITLHSGTGNLWVITDDPERLVELTDEGEFVRAVNLHGFHDTGGLCHLVGDRFAIAEEGKMRVTLVHIPPDATEITDDGLRVELNAPTRKNKGLEGVSYDAGTDTLFAVREGQPPTVYRLAPLLAQGTPNLTECPLDLHGLEDLSDVYFDPTANWLWLLSHESQVAVAFDPQGLRVASLRLRKGHHGLPESIPQAEGITRDRQGRLLICSEPNRIYRFLPVMDS